MGLGILQDKNMEHVPGTATLEHLNHLNTLTPASLSSSDTTTNRNLKLSTGNNPIILIPQPTDDPNDPLNWPIHRRDSILAILCILSVIASTLSPLLAANTLTLTLYFRRSFTDIALLTGYHLLGVGVAGLVFVVSARVWGKRHLYLLGTVIIVISSAWGGASGTSYKSLLWARVFQGVGLAPFEALVNASVADLYFVHERGKRMAVSNLALFGGAFFTPVIVGKMTESLGWQWCFWFVAIFTGAMLPLVVFCCPETTFVRPDCGNVAGISNAVGGGGGERQQAFMPEDDCEEMGEYDMTAGGAPTYQSTSLSKDQIGATTAESSNNNPPSSASVPKRISYARSLLPFNGRKSQEPFLNLLIRPFALFLHPAVLWACLIQGTLIGWTVLIGIILAAIMLLPPLSFNEVQTGYMYTGAFIGALVGFAIAGVFSDVSVKWLARKNNGVYEPEFRLLLVIPQLVFGCAGLYGFGVVAADTRRYGWFWADFFFGLEVVGMVLGAVAGALYLADAHRDVVVEAFTCLLVFKNLFSFGLTFGGYGWLVEGGIKGVFVKVASVQVGICCLTVFLYVFGKRNRSFFARHDILSFFHLR